MTAAGYSGTPLARKLGWKPGTRVTLWGAPRDYPSWLGPAAADLALVAARAPGRAPVRDGRFAAGHLFVTERAALGAALAGLRARIEPDGLLWISWPKKSSGVATDVTEDAIRALALPLGFVDVKVCAVTDVWSGLKLVVRKSER